MGQFSSRHIGIQAIAAAVPKQCASNRDYTLLSETERDFLIKTTGIEQRRIAPADVTCSDLCWQAAEQLLETRHIDRDDIGLLIFVSQSNDYYLPATAAILQHRLGLSKGCMAFDVGLGCSGYIYGLTLAASLMQTCGIKKALLLAGDTSSISCSPDDKSSYPLFGDAGSATLLTNEQTQYWCGNLFTDGAGADAIKIPAGMSRSRSTPTSFEHHDIAPGIRRSPLHLALQGEAIFAFSIKEVPASVRSLLTAFQLDLENLDYFVMHQANKLMNETIRKKLKLAADQTPYSLNEFGNTSSASIPLTLVARLATLIQHPCRLLLSGFGVGLSWGNLWIESDGIDCLPLIEVD